MSGPNNSLRNASAKESLVKNGEAAGEASSTRRRKTDAHIGHTSKRDLSIESLRGLAALLMVAGHVIGNTSERGMNVADDSIWRFLYVGLEDIRMPLFTVISGYVYAMRPVETLSSMPQLIRGKTRRLLLPLLVVGLLLFVMKLVVPETNARPEPSEFWRIYAYGYEHLWFLEAIFLVFLAVGILGALGALRTLRRWAVVTGFTFAVSAFVRLPENINFFSANGAIRLLPFFLVGYGMYRFGSLDFRGWRLLGPIALFAGLYTLKLVTIVGDWDPNGSIRRMIGFSVGFMGVVLIYSLRRVIRFHWLAWVGGFSFGVYLLHVFGSAAARMALGKLGIDLDIVVFAVCLCVGVGGPIVFQLMFGRWNFVRLLILGEKPRSSKPSQVS